MDPKNVVSLSSAPPQFALTESGSETDVWDPPFERWMKLADDLLSGWMCEASFGQPRGMKARVPYAQSKSS
jgi:hypothetical protein